MPYTQSGKTLAKRMMKQELEVKCNEVQAKRGTWKEREAPEAYNWGSKSHLFNKCYKSVILIDMANTFISGDGIKSGCLNPNSAT